jgi:Ferritin-like domain
MQEGSEMSTRAERPLTDDGEERQPDADPSAPGIAADLRPDRRRFLRRLTIGGAAVVAGAAIVPGLGEASASAQTSTTQPMPPTVPAGDVTLLNYAISLELAASQLYTDMAGTGRLGGDPLQQARIYVVHHSDHAAALSGVAAEDAISTPNATLLSQVAPQITAAASTTAIYQIAYNLEMSMAATHQQLMGTVENWQSSGAVASIEPVEAQHAVVWGQLLDLPTSQWMPAFQNGQGSFDPSKYAIS